MASTARFGPKRAVDFFLFTLVDRTIYVDDYCPMMVFRSMPPGYQ